MCQMENFQFDEKEKLNKTTVTYIMSIFQSQFIPTETDLYFDLVK